MRFLLIIILFLIFQSISLAAYIPGEILVRFKGSYVELKDSDKPISAKDVKIKKLDIKKALDKYEIKKIQQVFRGAKKSAKHIKSQNLVQLPDLSNTYKLVFPKEKDIFKIIEELVNNPSVEYAHPNYIVRKLDVIPNDPQYSLQWALEKINMPPVWDVTTGNNDIIIAVIDTGCDYNHKDLAGRITLGIDYVNVDIDPMDDDGHGTSLCGVIAAIGNNNLGIAGINWNAKILAVKVLDETGSGTIQDVSNGIQFAADNNAFILNLSLGDYVSSQTLKSAVDYAAAKGCLLIAAAGNDNRSSPMYPAAYNNVIAVAATDKNDKRAVWNASQSSNYGDWVNISAPGFDILSTSLNSSYRYEDGTSMSTPFVSGIASLISRVEPDWNAAQISQRITSTAANIDAQNPLYIGKLGAGRIDAAAALPAFAKITSPAPNQYFRKTLNIKGTADAVDFDRYELQIGKGYSPGTFTTIANNNNVVVNGTLATLDTTSLSDGIYILKLSVYMKNSQKSEDSLTLTIDNTLPAVDITQPAAGAVLTQSALIQGTASDKNLYFYSVDYSEDDKIYSRAFSSNNSINSGNLGTWNISGLSGSYFLKLTATDLAGNSSLKKLSVSLNTQGNISKSSIGQSFASPNPFNLGSDANTYIYYTLDNNFDTSIYIFNLTGKLILKRNIEAGLNGGKAGENLVAWNGTDHSGRTVSNGVYFFKIVADKNTIGRGKIIVLN